MVLPSIKIEKKIVDFESIDICGRNIFDIYDCIAFTSPNGVKYFMENMRDSRVDIRLMSGIKIASLNHATLDCMESYGIYPDIVSEKAYASSLANAIGKYGFYKEDFHKLVDIDEIKNTDTTGQDKEQINIRKVLLVGSNLSGKDLKQGLDEYGIDLDILVVYTNEPNIGYYPKIKEKIDNEPIDYMIFASESSVESIAGAIAGHSLYDIDSRKESTKKLKSIKTVAIGDTTARAMENIGIEASIVADEPSIERILDLIVADVEREVN